MAKTQFTYKEFENLDDDEWNNYFMGITDDQAIQSDIGGDSDADDCLDDSFASNTSSFSTRSRHEEPVAGTSSTQPTQENSQEIPSTSPIPSSSMSPPPPPPPPLQPEVYKDLNKWSNKQFRDPPIFKNSTFRNYVGINTEVNLHSSLQILTLFLTPFFFNLMITESNRYATQCHQTLNVTEEELKSFIGILIIMGFHSLPSLRLYWSQDKNFHVSRISSVMSMRRFLKIMRYWHVQNNENMIPRGSAGFDRLFKVRPLLTHFSHVFSSVFSPHQQLSIDESMIAFKGRSTLKQYMPLKPKKRGFKVWVMCCAVTGYMVSFDVYEGKLLEGARETSLSEAVVMKLGAMFEHLGYCLFFDRFFTSLPLLVKLLQKKLFGVGTIMPTKKIFPSSKLPLDRTMALGDSACAMTKSNISVSKWRDRGKKAVCVTSNMHRPNKKGFVSRTNSQGNKEQVACPVSIIDYNKYMGGVDKFDQYMSFYNISWKSRRWWMKIWYYMIEAAIVNSYIVYKNTWTKAYPGGTKPMTHLVFQSKLADELISEDKPVFPFHGDVRGDHQLIKSTKKNLRRCRYCSTSSKPKRSTYECVVCDVALCVECFVPFHSTGKKKNT